MLAQPETEVRCPTCGWRRWVGIVEDIRIAACSYCHGYEELP